MILYRNIRNEPRFKAIMKRAEDKYKAIREKVRKMEEEDGFDG
jgi:hypothetical protein